MPENNHSKKLLVCDVEGTIFKAEFKISGTDYASTMWQPLAHELDKYNVEHNIKDEHGNDFVKTTVQEEKESNDEWEKRENGKYKGKYLLWVEDTIRIHKKHQMCKSVFDLVLKQAEYQNGVEEFFKSIDTEKYIPVLISGGFQELAERAQRELIKGDNTVISHSFAACKYIWDDDGMLKAWNIQPTDFRNKYAYLNLILDQYGLSETSDWIFVGDGKNDADIASRAPVSFAINPHPELAAVSTYTIDSFDEINDLLNSDEIARGLSKKRGLSNKQSVLVGQRLLNADLLKQMSYTDNFKSSEEKVKFRIRAELADNSGGDVFEKTFDKIVQWCEDYSDDREKFKAEISECRKNDCFDYTYDGVAKISIACIHTGERKLGVEILSQDTGTKLRQAVLGAKTEIQINIQQAENCKNKLEMSVYVLTRTPDNSFIKNKIPLESYCPQFIKQLCKEGICVMIDGDKSLSSNFEDIMADDAIAVMEDDSRSVPVVFVSDVYANGSKQMSLRALPEYLCGFAKIYACKTLAMERLAERTGSNVEEVGAIVSFPQSSPEIYSKALIETPTTDAISYDDERNCRILYSKNDGCQTSAINIADHVISEYKARIENERHSEFKPYSKVSSLVLQIKTDNAIMLGRKKSAADIIDASKSAINDSVIDIERIERSESKITSELSGTRRADYIPMLTGVRKFLEKGELMIRLHEDLNSAYLDEKYPVSLLQPIACAFEICMNILLYSLSKEEYFDTRPNTKEYVGCGVLLKRIRDKRMITDFNILKILWLAKECRNESSHPNAMLALSKIIGEEKEKLYKAISEISKIL